MLLDPLQTRELFTHALAHRYAILAVNADSHAAVTDCLEAARSCEAPLIIETSLWQLEGHAYGRGDAVLGVARYLTELSVLSSSERYRDVPVVFHTDHIKGERTVAILTAALCGVEVALSDARGHLRASSVSLDASALSDVENVALLCRLATIAAKAGAPATFEMESDVDAGVTPTERARTLVGAVEEAHPGVVWLWAPGLGTRHGLDGTGYPEFRADLVAGHVRILKELTGRDIGLALHGSSGLGEEKLAEAVRAGVVKVNWSSESLLLRSRAAASYYDETAPRLDPGHAHWKAAAMDNGVQSYVAERYVPRVVERMQLLGGAGMACRFRGEGLDRSFVAGQRSREGNEITPDNVASG